MFSAHKIYKLKSQIDFNVKPRQHIISLTYSFTLFLFYFYSFQLPFNIHNILKNKNFQSEIKTLLCRKCPVLVSMQS